MQTQADSCRSDAGYSGVKGGALKKVLKPKARHETAGWIMERFGLSQRRASSLVSVSRRVFSDMPRENGLNDSIRKRMKELAGRFSRYGHWRLYIVLRRKGFLINHKRTERIYRSEKLSLRIRRRKKFASVIRTPLPEAVRANQIWAMDFVGGQWPGIYQ